MEPHPIVVGEPEIIFVEPAVGLEFYVEPIPRALHIGRIVVVEEMVAPAVSVDTEAGEFAPRRDGVETQELGGSVL